MTKFGVILFHTNSEVFRAEKLLSSLNLEIKLIPTPREFSSDCGLAIRFDWLLKTEICQILLDNKLDYSEIHFLG